MMAETLHPDMIRFGNQLADAAREIALRHFRTRIGVETKPDHSPVTEADREIEARLRQLVSGRYPDHGFFGEESGGEVTPGYCWVVDPIDGTKSFICGVPLFGSLIALLRERRPVLGIIDMAALRERWVGGAGIGTRFEGAAAHVSACTELSAARLFATSPDMFQAGDAAAFAALSARVGLRRFGTDCYAYGLLASGHCDLVVEANLKPYDVMALVPVVENAGGIVTGWNGKPIDPDFDGRIVAAASRSLHAEAISVLRSGAS